MKKKFTRKVLIKNIHTGNTATVEIYTENMTRESAEKEVKKVYKNSVQLLTIII